MPCGDNPPRRQLCRPANTKEWILSKTKISESYLWPCPRNWLKLSSRRLRINWRIYLLRRFVAEVSSCPRCHWCKQTKPNVALARAVTEESEPWTLRGAGWLMRLLMRWHSEGTLPWSFSSLIPIVTSTQDSRSKDYTAVPKTSGTLAGGGPDGLSSGLCRSLLLLRGRRKENGVFHKANT